MRQLSASKEISALKRPWGEAQNTHFLSIIRQWRTELINTEKDSYPQTRLCAEAFYATRPDIHGLCWVSRQDDRDPVARQRPSSPGDV